MGPSPPIPQRCSLTKKWPIADERALLANACVPGRSPHSLWNFVRFAAGWQARCLEPGQPAWLTERVHRPFFDWMQSKIDEWKAARRAGVQERVQVLAWLFRGSGKSNAITKCVPIYAMLDEPNLSSYIGSETHPKAKEFLAPIKSVIDGSDPFSLFPWLYGNWYSPERTWTTEQIVTAYRTSTGVTEPSIGTFGVETGITAKHPLLVIYDDPISEEKITEGGTFLQAAIDSLDSIFPALRNDSLLILIGTRYRDADVIGTTLDLDGVADWSGHRPLEDFKPGSWHVYFLQARDTSNTSKYPKGEPVLPEAGWTDEALERYERRRPQHYATQMMGDPATGEHMEITREQIKTLLIDRKDLPQIEYATIHLDTAFKEDTRREHGDRNVILTWLHDIRPTGIVYLDKILCSSSWRAEDFDTRIVSVLHDLRSRNIRVRAITDEKEMGGKRGVYLRHLQDVVSASGLRIPEILQLNRAGTKKVVRIREAANYWIDGYVRLCKDVENLELLILEMTRLGRSKHDDIADAAADVWLPTIWRGRHQTVEEGQPKLPVQPGDDVIKGKIEQEMEDIQFELRTGRMRDSQNEDFQPFDSLMDHGHW